MATLSEKIITVNTLGRSNLAEKGVQLGENVTTYDIMTAIANIVNSDNVNIGISYNNIVYNADNTITLTTKDGIVHTMECEYSEDGKLIAISYDGKPIVLTYEDDLLVKVGKTEVDVANAPLSPKLNFKTTILADVITPQHNAVFVEAVNVNSITTTIESEVNT